MSRTTNMIILIAGEQAGRTPGQRGAGEKNMVKWGDLNTD